MYVDKDNKVDKVDNFKKAVKNTTVLYYFIPVNFIHDLKLSTA